MAGRAWRLVGFVSVLGVVAGFGDVSALRTSSAEPFGPRWSVDIDGEMLGFELGSDRVYAVVHDGSMLEVVALELADGDVLWRQTAAEVDNPHRYAGGALDDGFLFSFEDRGPVEEIVVVVGSEIVGTDDSLPASSAPEPDIQPGDSAATPDDDDRRDAHLILLDGVSGEIRWDERGYDPAPYVSGHVNDHVAVVGVYDSGPFFLDLDTAEIVEMENSQETFWLLVGDELARFDGGSLVLGLDPFDPAAKPTTVPLPAGTVSVTASEDGRQIVATVGSDLVGIVDGEEVWTWTPDVEGIGYVLLVDGFVGVRELVGGTYGRFVFAEIADRVVVPLETFPDNFRFEGVWFAADGTPALVGVMDETPDMNSRDERVRGAVVELRTGTPTREIVDDLNGFGTAGAFGAYIFTASVIDGQISIYDGDTLERVTAIPFMDEDEVRPTNLHVSDDEIVVYDPEQSTISAYA
jgi:hypothetical protein